MSQLNVIVVTGFGSEPDRIASNWVNHYIASKNYDWVQGYLHCQFALNATRHEQDGQIYFFLDKA